jgi:hypothetical protein
MAAGLEVARNHGLVPIKPGEKHHIAKGSVQYVGSGDEMKHGIAAFRWLTQAGELEPVLSLAGRDYIQLANSWGRTYPRRVRMPLDTVNRLLAEDGELGVVTDR